MRKTITKIFAGLLCVVMMVGLCGCGSPVTNNSNNTNQTENSHISNEQTETTQPTESELYANKLDGFEAIAYDEDCCVYYLREGRTDVMYALYKQKFMNAGFGGLTVMLHPEDGTPLLYSEWVEMGK